MRNFILLLATWILFFVSTSFLWAEDFRTEELVFFDDLADQAFQELVSLRKAPFKKARTAYIPIAEDLFYDLYTLKNRPPLSHSEVLSHLACSLTEGLLKGSYSWDILRHPEEIKPLAANFGYEGKFLGLSVSALLFEQAIAPEEALKLLYRHLEEAAFSDLDPQAAPLIFPFYSEVGICMAGGRLFFRGQEYNAYLLMFVFGLSWTEDTPLLIGRVEDFTPTRWVKLRNVYGETLASRLFADGTFYFHVFPLDFLQFPLEIQVNGQQLEIMAIDGLKIIHF